MPPFASKATGSRRNYRWWICALLFFATTINYIDRQVLGILKPHLSALFGWSEIDYSNIILSFQMAYALGYLFGGRMMDRVGVRRGYAAVVLVWSMAAMSHGLVALVSPTATLHLSGQSSLGHLLIWGLYGTSSLAVATIPWTVIGFCTARIVLGLAEGGNFPAAIKAIGEWYPKRERALATGLFNAGSNIGALITPLAVPWITLAYGWPAAFCATGLFSLCWVTIWLRNYRAPKDEPRLSDEERAYILSDPVDPPIQIPWLSLLRFRQTWAFVVGMFLVSPIWWFYLYWIPGFLHDKHGLNLLQMGAPLVAIYLFADVGSIGGGWFSSTLLRRGWSLNAARKTAMLTCALCVVPVYFTSGAENTWVATGLIALAAAAHQGFSANLYTLVSDTVPSGAVSSVVGIGGMAGAIGGMFIAKLAGFVLQWTGSYQILFTIAAGAYLVALIAIHLLNPRLEPMDLRQLQSLS